MTGASELAGLGVGPPLKTASTGLKIRNGRGHRDESVSLWKKDLCVRHIQDVCAVKILLPGEVGKLHVDSCILVTQHSASLGGEA